MNNDKILFIDLLYSEYGSYDDDFEAINKSLTDFYCYHLKCDVRFGLSGLLRVIFHVFSFKYNRIVFLSAKISHLVILAPLRFIVKAYAIYHFMPNSRVKMHSYLIPFLYKFFNFATYADSVSDLCEKISGIRPPSLPSRIVESAESEQRLREKFLSSGTLRVMVPGVRLGVRRFIDPVTLLAQLEQATGIHDIRLFIQGTPVDLCVKNPRIEYLKLGIPKDEYDALYKTCHAIAVEFEDAYEVRASGVILDAAAHGCIVLTAAHAITISYGFPNTILCDNNRAGLLVGRIRSGEPLRSLVPGVGVNEFGRRWHSFLAL